MAFKEKYSVTAKYLSSRTKRRPGLRMNPGVKFIVAHDTGNPGSTANGNVRYYENSNNEMSASAHLFVDDKEIIECIPALTGPPEKAWHVRYNVDQDDKLFGHDSNDAAVGVEYCYGGRINADEAYARYIWVMAFICFKFKLDPRNSIVGHYFLDPTRKTDPVSGLAHSRRTFEQMLDDVVAEYIDCGGILPEEKKIDKKGQAIVNTRLNIRIGAPNTRVPVAYTALPGDKIDYIDLTSDGQKINGNSTWLKTKDNH